MLWDEFYNIPNGQRIFNNGFDECVALANLYHQSVLGGSFVPVKSAYQWWTEYGRYAQLSNIYDRLSVDDNPRAGDVFVARYGMYDAPNGHIGVVVRDWDGSTFGTKEQNAERNRYSYQIYNRTKANILGFLRPKTNPVPNAPTDGMGETDVFIADVRGTWYIIVPGSPKPKAVMLDGESGAPGSLPLLKFTENFSIDALRWAVDGVH